jgi:hypothetical protein
MNKKWLENNGFKGFVKISFLKSAGYKEIPKIKGIYVVVRESNEKPVFLDESIGGHFKGKNPAVNLKELESNWVNSQIMYIGKAGGANSGATLKSRLRQYMEKEKI